jgi:cysteine rich repeat protein
MARSLPRFLVVATALSAATLAAQMPSGSEGLGKPCADDVAKLCPGVKPGGGRIVRCLQGKADQISAACKARMEQAKEVHQACMADAEKLCSNIPPGAGRVAVCIQQHEAELSQTCRTHIQQVRTRFNEVKEACRDDAGKFCSNVPPGRGRVAVCLHEHAAELSDGCKAQLTR